MKPPFWKCCDCNLDIRKVRFPITKRTRVPVCPKCLQWKNVDIVIGYDDTVLTDKPMDSEEVLSLDTVIFKFEEEE